MLKIEFYDPSGAMLAGQPHAPRLNTLNGKKIGFVSIDEWQAYRTFPMIREFLKSDFPDADLMPMDAFPRGIGPVATEELASLVSQSGADAIIIGNAA